MPTKGPRRPGARELPTDLQKRAKSAAPPAHPFCQFTLSGFLSLQFGEEKEEGNQVKPDGKAILLVSI
jgi:hypothetical protein